MKTIFQFNIKYLLAAVILFFIEVMIALYVRDNFVRPYVGDYLVVMLMYCAIRAFIKAPAHVVAIGVLLFAYLIELLQYWNFVETIGLGDNELARTVLGTGFELKDLVAYTLGVVTILIIEKRLTRKRNLTKF